MQAEMFPALSPERSRVVDILDDSANPKKREIPSAQENPTRVLTSDREAERVPGT